MTTSPPPSQGHPLAASSLADLLIEDEYVEDAGAIAGVYVPEWLQRLGVPQGWMLVEIADNSRVPLARIAVCGPRDDDGWEATETISVFGYTGRLMFGDVFSNASGTLRALDATDITTKVLPIPPTQHAAALRSSGIAVIGDRRVWVQQSNYLAGSYQRHAGRLYVHSIFVDSQCLTRLAEDIARMSDAVYLGFVTTLGNEHRAG
ncbi:hypothetical protein [Mycobacterium riyadhense]|uniref:Uncharacterized protein n=1 Tax=Mycobacterium riyadhense TaxID=486698 RepID=A0A653EDY8_9MYCO|nr:hypothetical protein [Mycobacterium riyadhense]VTO94821.1 hypothetical protein BIN_B_00295 [Mycobacterium riyadhense]